MLEGITLRTVYGLASKFVTRTAVSFGQRLQRVLADARLKREDDSPCVALATYALRDVYARAFVFYRTRPSHTLSGVLWSSYPNTPVCRTRLFTGYGTCWYSV